MFVSASFEFACPFKLPYTQKNEGGLRLRNQVESFNDNKL